jgi:hypothetical protein
MIRLIYALILVLLMAAPSLGQQSLVGTYKLISQTHEVDGAPIQTMDKSPHGYLVITPTRYVVFITEEGRKFGTSVAEKAALYDSLTAWSGVYRIEGNRIIVKVDGSWMESWNGKDQSRGWELSGKSLKVTSGPQPFAQDPSKKVMVRQVWEKIE